MRRDAWFSIKCFKKKLINDRMYFVQPIIVKKLIPYYFLVFLFIAYLIYENRIVELNGCQVFMNYTTFTHYLKLIQSWYTSFDCVLCTQCSILSSSLFLLFFLSRSLVFSVKLYPAFRVVMMVRQWLNVVEIIYALLNSGSQLKKNLTVGMSSSFSAISFS